MISQYDVIVVGGGHAGCEAALAAARLGCKTLLLTMNPDTIAQMSCNPAIGGPAAKSHLVREIDALGGEMGRVIDKTFLNIRMLNESRGPAVHALRAQADKRMYQMVMIKTLENQPGLDVKQGLVSKVLVADGEVEGVMTRSGSVYGARAVILCTGTFLGGRIVIGDASYPGGRQGEPSADDLSDNLRQLGFRTARFQTATPPRIDRRSVDFSQLTEQPGSAVPLHFSFDPSPEWRMPDPQMPCWWTRTSRRTVEVIRMNMERSPIKSGNITSRGPRFCPSIDRKVLYFPDKMDHQIFLEPEGKYTEELYALGLTTAMPEDVQVAIVRSIPGLERAELIRAGYAVEYDYLPPTQITPWLETKTVKGLFTAGQINGTSGYEEAACQGLIAGINAALRCKGRNPLVLDRSEAYIGVLIDDLVTKGVEEPYRMMTSRAEYRLSLRQDNADMRLTERGWKLGLIPPDRYERFRAKKSRIEAELEWLRNTQVTPSSEIRETLRRLQSGDLAKPAPLSAILRRPEISYHDLRRIVPEEKEHLRLEGEEAREVEIEIKFEGYIDRQRRQIQAFKGLEDIEIPPGLDYSSMAGLRKEARDRLREVMPATLGQAARIPGVSPADISVILVGLRAGIGGGGAPAGPAPPSSRQAREAGSQIAGGQGNAPERDAPEGKAVS